MWEKLKVALHHIILFSPIVVMTLIDFQSTHGLIINASYKPTPTDFVRALLSHSLSSNCECPNTKAESIMPLVYSKIIHLLADRFDLNAQCAIIVKLQHQTHLNSKCHWLMHNNTALAWRTFRNRLEI